MSASASSSETSLSATGSHREIITNQRHQVLFLILLYALMLIPLYNSSSKFLVHSMLIPHVKFLDKIKPDFIYNLYYILIL